ncbi:MAG: TatD family deoxyribonuclease [Flexistipes sinusarabici]|uniref:TatD family deoxyribonuclease n=1 Tax=Flexistipes sinusarabici TaxID=2352 RepID=A0A5D0MMP4_FLESI|nr:TatD family hydrolase [Flexistipes sinusarabici]TYB32883.1 MAG: TatD family deoxyribonuclease [Flexistipes sinusarabici]
MLIKKRSGEELSSFLNVAKRCAEEGVFLTDTHAHLHFPEMVRDIDDHLKEASKVGVERFITVGINKKDSSKALKLAEEYENIFASAGIHPHDASEFNHSDIDFFIHTFRKEKAVAVGEIGLDYFRNHSPKDIQKDVFALFLDLSVSEKLPFIIHNREATKDLIAVADPIVGKKNHGGIVHCFNGDKELMKWALDAGLFISFAGNLTYKKADELRDALKYIPLDRLLVETDCPYLSPMPFRGKQNVPANVIFTAYTVCKVKDIDYKNLLFTLENNINNLYNIAHAKHIDY